MDGAKPGRLCVMSNPRGQEKFTHIVDGLRLPVMSAPMFLASGPEIVIAAARAGIIGSFPAANARTVDILDQWLGEIVTAAPQGVWAANVIVHRTYDRLDAELDRIGLAAPSIVAAALGNPGRIVERVHSWGGLVFSDVTTPEQARRALDAGADGLIMVCAGAGGHTGPYSPFALLPEIREFWSGPVIAGGGVGTGSGIAAMRMLGADVVNLGTRFLATTESRIVEGYRHMLIESHIGDIVTDSSVTGVAANWLADSLDSHEPDPSGAGLDFSGTIAESKAWRDVWSSGQAVGAIRQADSVADVVSVLEVEYDAAMSIGDRVAGKVGDSARRTTTLPAGSLPVRGETRRSEFR